MATATDASTAGTPRPAYASHAEKTIDQPRSPERYIARITHIAEPTPSIRLIDFQVLPRGGAFRFKAGQWVDLFVPEHDDKPGGFSIISSPKTGLEEGTFRLAVQQAPRNPAAAYLFRPTHHLISSPPADSSTSSSATRTTPPPPAPSTTSSSSSHRDDERGVKSPEFEVSVGGTFTFPPFNFRSLGPSRIFRIVLIGGGIGANPLISILHALRDSRAPVPVEMMYAIKSPRGALYLDTLRDAVDQGILKVRLFVSDAGTTTQQQQHQHQQADERQSHDVDGLGVTHYRRFDERDLDATIGLETDAADDEETIEQQQHGTAAAATEEEEEQDAVSGRESKHGTLYYICGPAQMTDFVESHLLKRGVPQELVQTERWW